MVVAEEKFRGEINIGVVLVRVEEDDKEVVEK